MKTRPQPNKISILALVGSILAGGAPAQVAANGDTKKPALARPIMPSGRVAVSPKDWGMSLNCQKLRLQKLHRPRRYV